MIPIVGDQKAQCRRLLDTKHPLHGKIPCQRKMDPALGSVMLARDNTVFNEYEKGGVFPKSFTLVRED